MQLRLVALMVVVLASSAAAQTAPSDGCIPPAAVLRQRALELVKADRSTDAVLLGLDEFMGVDNAAMTIKPVSTVHYSEELFIGLLSPYTSYRTAVAEALRKREDVAAVQVQRDIRIVVSPSRIDAPDIVRVLVERDGKPVPATMAEPVLIADSARDNSVDWRNTVPFNTFGLPAISVPCGVGRAGLPVGLQIVGPHFGESRVLALAHAFEQHIGSRRRPSLA